MTVSSPCACLQARVAPASSGRIPPDYPHTARVARCDATARLAAWQRRADQQARCEETQSMTDQDASSPPPAPPRDCHAPFPAPRINVMQRTSPPFDAVIQAGNAFTDATGIRLNVTRIAPSDQCATVMLDLSSRTQRVEHWTKIDGEQHQAAGSPNRRNGEAPGPPYGASCDC